MGFKFLLLVCLTRTWTPGGGVVLGLCPQGRNNLDFYSPWLANIGNRTIFEKIYKSQSNKFINIIYIFGKLYIEYDVLIYVFELLIMLSAC